MLAVRTFSGEPALALRAVECREIQLPVREPEERSRAADEVRRERRRSGASGDCRLSCRRAGRESQKDLSCVPGSGTHDSAEAAKTVAARGCGAASGDGAEPGVGGGFRE